MGRKTFTKYRVAECAERIEKSPDYKGAVLKCGITLSKTKKHILHLTKPGFTVINHRADTAAGVTYIKTDTGNNS